MAQTFYTMALKTAMRTLLFVVTLPYFIQMTIILKQPGWNSNTCDDFKDTTIRSIRTEIDFINAKTCFILFPTFNTFKCATSWTHGLKNEVISNVSVLFFLQMLNRPKIIGWYHWYWDWSPHKIVYLWEKQFIQWGFPEA